MNNLNCDDIRQNLLSGATLLDVRNVDEFSRGALPDAKNIPLAILPLLADERLEKHAPIFVYCHGGGRAMMAEKILAGMGFSNVTNIGGIQHYQHCC
jgi:rhodanese-related sulfurtransferase